MFGNRNGGVSVFAYLIRLIATELKNGSLSLIFNTEVCMILDRIALVLTIIGALNWGSIGIFSFDIVAWICGGQDAIAARIIYTVVALAGVWCISLLFRPRELAEKEY